GVVLRGGEFEAGDDVGLLRHFSLIHCLILSSSPRSTSQARMSIPMAASTRPMSQSSPVHCAPRTVRDHTSPSATAAGIANRPAMTEPTTTPAIRRKYLAGMGSSTVIRTGSPGERCVKPGALAPSGWGARPTFGPVQRERFDAHSVLLFAFR